MSIFNELHRESAELARHCRSLIGSLERSAEHCERIDREFESLRSMLQSPDPLPSQSAPPQLSASALLVEAFKLIGEVKPMIYLSKSEWRCVTKFTGRIESGRADTIGRAFEDLWGKLGADVEKGVFDRAAELVKDI